MSELKEKLNSLDEQNLQNNDTLYSILEEIIDKIEDLEKNGTKNRKHDADYYLATVHFSKRISPTGRAIFTYHELSRFIERIIEDKP